MVLSLRDTFGASTALGTAPTGAFAGGTSQSGQGLFERAMDAMRDFVSGRAEETVSTVTRSESLSQIKASMPNPQDQNSVERIEEAVSQAMGSQKGEQQLNNNGFAKNVVGHRQTNNNNINAGQEALKTVDAEIGNIEYRATHKDNAGGSSGPQSAGNNLAGRAFLGGLKLGADTLFAGAPSALSYALEGLKGKKLQEFKGQYEASGTPEKHSYTALAQATTNAAATQQGGGALQTTDPAEMGRNIENAHYAMEDHAENLRCRIENSQEVQALKNCLSHSEDIRDSLETRAREGVVADRGNRLEALEVGADNEALRDGFRMNGSLV